MKAIRIHEFGDADRLVYEEIAVPDPKPGEVRVKVETAGLNFVEIYQRKGGYMVLPPFPYTPGGELAGTVDSVGADVTDFKVGDRVATANGTGAYGDYGIAPAAKLVHIPASVSSEQAAAVILQGITAHYLAYSTYPLKPGDTALVHAAAGGVGLLLVQIAKMCGARVIATVSTDEKAALAREAGADEVILYSRDDFEAVTKHLTGGKGVEVVFDSVGKTTFLKGLNVLKSRGYMVLYGQASGVVDPLEMTALAGKSLFVTRPTLGNYVLTRDELLMRTEALFEWVQSGALKVRIDRRFPLAEAAEAHRYMEGRGTKGKVLLVP